MRGVVSRAIFTIAFGCVRHEEDRPEGDEVYEDVEDDIPQFRGGRRVHNTDGPMISEILHGTKRGETRASSYAHIHAYVHISKGVSM